MEKEGGLMGGRKEETEAVGWKVRRECARKGGDKRKK